MGNDVPGVTVEGDAQAGEAGELGEAAPSGGWRPSKRVLIIAVAAVVGIVAVSILASVVVDQVTRVSVPSVEGETLADATGALEATGLELQIQTESDFCDDDDLAAELCVVASQTPAPSARVHTDETVTIDVVASDVTIPSLQGMTYDEAESATAALGLKIRPADTADYRVEGFRDWEVTGQSEHGAVPAGSKLDVTLDHPLADAPNVVGASLQSALDTLTAAGFKPSLANNPGSSYDPAWVVTGTDPEVVDGRLPLGGNVTLNWGVQVPNVIGMTDLAANSTLSNARLKVVGSKSSSQKVASQDPAPGTVVGTSSNVTITLEEPSIVYEVVGNGSRASITWIPPGTYDIAQATNEPLPWRMTWPGSSGYRNFNAQILNGNSVTCNIYVNGQLLKTNTSTGQYAVVSCG